MTTPAVTVAVPVFNGRPWLKETVAAVRSQSCDNLIIVLGVDVSTDGSAELANELAANYDNVRCIVHEARKGFEENLNSLLASVETEYLCLLPQDDWIHPDYINTLLGCLHANPSAVLAYCDMARDDMRGYVQHQASLVGDKCTRLVQYLAMQMNHLEWRGLVRLSAVCGPITFSGCDVVDHRYPLFLAEFGDLIRVPKVLYTKRIHPKSATAAQRQTGEGRRVRIAHALVSCFACYRHVVTKIDSKELKTLCRIALLARILRLIQAEWPILHMDTVSDDDLIVFGDVIQRRGEWVLQLGESIESVLKSDLAEHDATPMLVSLSYFYLLTLGESLNMRGSSKELALKSITSFPAIEDYDEFFRVNFRRILGQENQGT